MNVYDLAHSLARELKKSPEYTKYQKALAEIKGNKEREKILSDIRRKQMEIQTMQIMGKEVPPDKMKEFEKVSELLNLHPSIKEFFEAEFLLGRVITDVQKIIGEAMELWTPDFAENKE